MANDKRALELAIQKKKKDIERISNIAKNNRRAGRIAIANIDDRQVNRLESELASMRETMDELDEVDFIHYTNDGFAFS